MATKARGPPGALQGPADAASIAAVVRRAAKVRPEGAGDP
jgi:hypothetical protein